MLIVASFAFPNGGSIFAWVMGLSWVEQGLLAACTMIIAIYGAWKPTLSLYQWTIAKHNDKVLRLLRESYREHRLQAKSNVVILPVPLADIAREAKRSQKSVYRTLRRLEHEGKVKEYKDGWAPIENDTIALRTSPLARFRGQAFRA